MGALVFRLRRFKRAYDTLAKANQDGIHLFRLPRQAFLADLTSWCGAGLVMTAIYYAFFTPYPSTGAKVLMACAALGILSGMLGYLSMERRLVHVLQQQAWLGLPAGRNLTVSRKINILVSAVTSIMALTILMMVFLDMYELVGLGGESTIYWGIFKEITFALVILLGVSLFIVHGFSKNLKAVLDTQLAAMEEISRGNLEKQVPIVTTDEFAHLAEKTNQMMEGLKERDFCRASFDSYVSPEVSRKILDDSVAPAGELVEVSVLFCDLRNYTGFAETHSPRETVSMLNAYFTAMEQVIRKHKGIVLQFIGDEIEAVFGAPEPDADHPENAVAAALEMDRALGRFNKDRRERGEIDIRHGIGIHTGEVLAGNVGSAQRKTYAMLGDTVNLASRLQALTKSLGAQILISHATRGRLTDGRLRIKPLGWHALKGKANPVEVYTIESYD
ncbi:MAG: adenylate/guanylate cyclase domain-containing protein [Desulfobacterales bacterium]|nr:adenylate/guanylate cyclase domain-containing protein [Desulfobacterales bacterium]